jgi:ketosteroid isomerase-like protein
MKKLFTVLALTLLATGLAGAQNDPARDVRQLERAWLDAYEQHDEKAMDAIVAEDFVITFPDGGQQTKPQILASLRSPRRPGQPTVKFSTENVSARVYGDTVILSGRVVTERIRDGQTISKEGQLYTDTYVKLKGKWQVVASHLSNEKKSQ